MDAKQAYTILQRRWPVSEILDCRDFGSFFAFHLSPVGTSNRDGFYVGPNMYAVDKRTGKVSIYDITTNPDAYLKSKLVNVKDIMSTRLSEVKRE